jgi:predicted phage terminase large subunit-like protein
MAFEAAAAEWDPPPEDDGPRWETPGDLAKAIDPATRQTPALDRIDEGIAWAYSTPGARLLVSMPPQEGKTVRCSKVGSLWALTRNPETRIGIASYAQSLAEGFGREVRNWITTYNGDEGTLDLGLRIARDNGSARRWQLDGHRGGIVCVGIGSGLTGRPLDALVIDDPFADAEQAGSAYYRDRVWDWWQSVGSPRLAPGAPAIVILTRWHENDLAGRLVAAEDGHRWRVINIPALADHDPARGQSDPLGREPGEWLTSARGRTVAEWEQIRIQAGSRVFAALYQGRPSPDAGNVWQRQWWRRYGTPLWSQHPDRPDAYLVHEYDELLISVDAAFKDTKSSDYVVIQVWCRRGANVYLLDQVRKRLSFTDTLTAFLAMVARWPQAARKLIEDKANGTAVIDSLKAKIPGLIPVTPHESKYARASAVSPFIEAGNVFLPAAEIALFDAEAFIDEAAGFPNAAHDDQVDGASQALAELLLDGNGAQAWIAWAKRKAEEAAAAPDLATAEARVRELYPSPYQECRKPDCLRMVSLGAAYCCVPCSDAADGGCEIHAHSNGCDQRAAERSNGHAPAEDPPSVPLDPAEARRMARNAAFKAGAWT